MQQQFPNRGYRVCDVHAHIFPQAIAEKATVNIGRFYGYPMEGVAGVDNLLAEQRRAGVARSLVFSAATAPKQAHNINDYITRSCEEYGGEFVGFGTLHPYMEDVEREVARCVELGLHGFKFHPDLQRFYIDEPKAVEMFRAIKKYDMKVLLHMGDGRYDYSAPERLRNIMELCPGLFCIAAHFGGHQRWFEVKKYLTGLGLYFDTSSSLAFMTGEMAVDFIRYFGADRFMFGSDFPMWNASSELERFFELDLTEDEREQVLHGTFDAIFD